MAVSLMLATQSVIQYFRFRKPVNRFPDFVRYTVQRLKALCPQMGKVVIAQLLARAGLHLAPTTVGRILKEERQEPHSADLEMPSRQVTAKRLNHVWHRERAGHGVHAVPRRKHWSPASREPR